MKRIVAVFLLLISGAVAASTVTIDFDGVPDDSWSLSNDVFDGYQFSYIPIVDEQIEILVTQPSCCASVSFNFSREDGQLFSLDSAYIGPLFYALEFVGGYADGGITAQTFNFETHSEGLALFDSSFAQLAWVSVELAIPPAGPGGWAILDDITLTTVPVPAAVWLFASALAGLGYLRRR